MTQSKEATREEILARLELSREEIRSVLDPAPAPPGAGGAAPSGLAGEFPRSRTMRMLLSSRGLAAVAAVLGGVVLARPALVWRLMRLLPTGAVARVLLLRALGTMRRGGSAEHE